MTATSPQFNVASLCDLVTTEINNGASLSDAVDLRGHSLVAIQMPVSWTAAGLSFQSSVDGITYGNVKDEGAEYTVAAVAADDFVPINPNVFLGCRYLRLRSGTSGAAVNQGALRTLKLAIAPFFSGS
jgi:hypothetical protein